MDLDEYLWRKKIKQKVFAEMVGVQLGTIHHLRRRAKTPSLSLALNIVDVTNGEIEIENLMSLSDALKRDVKKKLNVNPLDV